MADFIEEPLSLSVLRMPEDEVSILDERTETGKERRNKAYVAVHVWTLMMVESTGIGRQQGTDQVTTKSLDSRMQKARNPPTALN